MNCSEISEAKFWQIAKCFALDLTATQCVGLTGLSLNTIDRFYTEFHELIVAFNEENPSFQSETEDNESCFGSRHVRGKYGLGAGPKAIDYLTPRFLKKMVAISPYKVAKALVGNSRNELQKSLVGASEFYLCEKSKDKLLFCSKADLFPLRKKYAIV